MPYIAPFLFVLFTLFKGPQAFAENKQLESQFGKMKLTEVVTTMPDTSWDILKTSFSKDSILPWIVLPG